MRAGYGLALSSTVLAIGSHNSDQFFAGGGTVYIYERYRDGITAFALVKTIAPTAGSAYLGALSAEDEARQREGGW